LHKPGFNRAFAILVLALFAGVALATPGDDDFEIRSFVEGLDGGAAPIIGGQRLNEPAVLADVYRDRDFTPIWLPGGPLELQAAGLLLAIDQSAAHGFAPQRYHLSIIEKLAEGAADPAGIAIELLLTDAFLAQALHRGRGVVSPASLDPEWLVPLPEVDAAALLAAAAAQELDVIEVLDSLWPTDEEYQRLVERRAEIAASDDEVTINVPPGPLLRPGQTSDRIVLLKERLLGPGEYSPLYDDELLPDVKAFQLAAGLEPDGLVGDATLEMLNATRVSWIDTIDANLERWRWLPRETPDTYIRVNIAAFVLRAIEDGHVAFSMNVIVGQPYRRTPVFTETIKYLVLNPYWNVPYSIATKDKLPLLRADAAAQAQKGFEAKTNGSDVFVAVDAIDWSGVTPRNFGYALRQLPGPDNALGRIKFMLPNPFAVYLHDTPGRELFSRQERTFSSGCIRLEQPQKLAEWLLAREGQTDGNLVGSLLATGETQTLYLKKPIPIRIVYFTAFSLESGTVTFRRDVYGRDAPLIEALREQQP